MKKKNFIFLIAAGLILIGAITPPLVRYTSTPEFCASCHVMDNQFEAWHKSALHRHLKCVDCHLPNNNAVNHLIWKGIDGTKDLVKFHTKWYQEPISITNHGKGVVQANCIRCHGHMNTHVNTENRTCADCHRRTKHRIAPFTMNENLPGKGK